MSDINVTPLVDVMLVLLVIFMITAPLLTAGVQVDLPKSQAAAIQGQDEPISVTVDQRGRIFVQETEVTLDSLEPRLSAITHNNRDVRVFVRGDRGHCLWSGDVGDRRRARRRLYEGGVVDAAT